MEEKGFTLEVTSRDSGWWRYNVALMCGCFDAADQRTGFASAATHAAEVGSNFAQRPDNIRPDHTTTLETPPCDHLIFYIYVVPHTLPVGREIDSTKPFDIELKISYNGRQLRSEKHTINQWSGASIELKITR